MEVFNHFNYILSSFNPSESIYILADIAGADQLSEANMSTFSYVFMAVIIIETTEVPNYPLIGETHQRTIFSEVKPFFILDLPLTLSASVAQFIYNLFRSQSEGTFGSVWKPTIIIVLNDENGINSTSHTDTSSLSLRSTQLRLVYLAFVNFTLHLDSSIFILQFKRNSQPSVWEIYNVKQKQIFAKISDINFSSSPKINLEATAKRRGHLFGERLTVVVKGNDSKSNAWSKVELNPDGSYFLTAGYLESIYSSLQIAMNFRPHVVTGDRPVFHQNGTFSGETMAKLRNDEADFSLIRIPFDSHMSKGGLISLIPTQYSMVYIFFKQPSINSIRNIVTSPLDSGIWFVLIGFWGFILISLQIHILIRKVLLWRRGDLHLHEKDKLFLKEHGLWCTAAISQRSYYLDPESFSLKIKFIIGSLTSLIIYTAYSTFILSSLAVSQVPISSFADLTKYKFIFTAPEDSRSLQGLLAEMVKQYHLNQNVVIVPTKEHVRHLYTRPSSFNVTQYHRGRIQSTKKALISFEDSFYSRFNEHPVSFICEHISSFPLTNGIKFANNLVQVKRGSQFKEVLSYMLLYLRGFGLIQRSNKVYARDTLLQCISDDLSTPFEAIELSDVLTILLGFGIGTCLTLLIFVGEKFWKKCSNRYIHESRHQKYMCSN